MQLRQTAPYLSDDDMNTVMAQESMPWGFIWRERVLNYGVDYVIWTGEGDLLASHSHQCWIREFKYNDVTLCVAWNRILLLILLCLLRPVSNALLFFLYFDGKKGGVLHHGNMSMPSGGNATAWNEINPRWGDFILFDATKADGDDLTKTRCKTLELQWVFINGLLGRTPP